MTIKSIFLGAALSVAVIGTASADLVENGSFEADQVSSWTVFDDITGWETQSGTGIEIQNNGTLGSVDAQDGEQYVELDSHDKGVNDSSDTNSVMAQTVDGLTDGNTYTLSFWYQARTNNDDDNGINVYWGDIADAYASVSGTSSTNSEENGGWTNYTYEVVAYGDSMLLGFGAFGKQNTLGGFIDNVSLTLASVPEPATFALLGLGIFGLAAARKARA